MGLVCPVRTSPGTQPVGRPPHPAIAHHIAASRLDNLGARHSFACCSLRLGQIRLRGRGPQGDLRPRCYFLGLHCWPGARCRFPLRCADGRPVVVIIIRVRKPYDSPPRRPPGRGVYAVSAGLGSPAGFFPERGELRFLQPVGVPYVLIKGIFALILVYWLRHWRSMCAMESEHTAEM